MATATSTVAMESSAVDRRPQAAAQSFEKLMTSFNKRILELQQVLVLREASSLSAADLESVEITVRALEHQLEDIKTRLREEAETIPKAKALVGLSLQQEQRLKLIHERLPTGLPGIDHVSFSETAPASSEMEATNGDTSVKPTDNAQPKEKKGKGPPPRWYVTVEEFDSLSSYMRGRLTLEKINAAVDEMAVYAEANARLLAAPRKKLGEDMIEKALELRDFAAHESVKGKHFFFESDLRGPVLKMDHTGKSILTVLRHLGRVSDIRTSKHRGLVLAKP